MTCTDTNEPVTADEVTRLFVELEACGLERLEPIERDIVEALRERPRHLWCKGPFLLLRCLHAKAFGLPWTELVSSRKP